MGIKFGQVRHAGVRRKLLNGKEVSGKTSLLEVEEQFEYDGFFFNVHRGRENTKKWGVSESTTGLTVSMDKSKPDGTQGYLHTTKAGAIKMAIHNLENAKKEKNQPTGYFVFKARTFQSGSTSLFVELKKYKLR